jgi:hypothetical protein
VRFGAAFWIQRTDWPGLRDACVAAERAGWDTIWLDDHLLSDEASPDDPKLEGWASLHAVASVTSRARLGLLVSSTTFRNPGVISKLATTLDHVSGGRAVLGLGGGWFDREHEAFGIDFGSGFGERLVTLDPTELGDEGRIFKGSSDAALVVDDRISECVQSGLCRLPHPASGVVVAGLEVEVRAVGVFGVRDLAVGSHVSDPRE